MGKTSEKSSVCQKSRTDMSLLLRLVLCFVVTAVAEGAFGHSKPTEDFDKDISKHFLTTSKRS